MLMMSLSRWHILSWNNTEKDFIVIISNFSTILKYPECVYKEPLTPSKISLHYHHQHPTDNSNQLHSYSPDSNSLHLKHKASSSKFLYSKCSSRLSSLLPQLSPPSGLLQYPMPRTLLAPTILLHPAAPRASSTLSSVLPLMVSYHKILIHQVCDKSYLTECRKQFWAIPAAELKHAARLRMR